MGLFGFKKKKLEQERLEKERQEQIQLEQSKQYNSALENYKRKDYEAAHRIWNELANQGDVNSMHCLAVTYEKGQGVKQDDTLAFKWYSQAAREGCKESYFGVATLYKDGRGTEKNINKAIEYFTKAADAGIVDCEAILGCMYLYGEDIPTDFEKAYHYLKSAVEHGDVDSMYHYAQMLSNEQYGHIDMYNAYLNYEIASQHGHEKATDKVIECLVKGLGTVINYDKAREIVRSKIEKGFYADPQSTLSSLEEFIQKNEKELEMKREKARQEEIRIQNTPIMTVDGKKITKDNISSTISSRVEKGAYVLVNNKIYLVIFRETRSFGRGRMFYIYKLEDINTKEEIQVQYRSIDNIDVITDISKIETDE